MLRAFERQVNGRRWVARKHRGRSTRVAVRASRDLTPAAPAPRGAPATIPQRPRAALPHHHTPRGLQAGRSCQLGLSSVVRAAQPATQADAAARPKHAGHFAARSRHARGLGVSWRRSLVAIRWLAYMMIY